MAVCCESRVANKNVGNRSTLSRPRSPDQSILILPEVFMDLSVAMLGAAVVVVALLAIYVPTIYIRKTNKLIGLLERIEANTRK
jgi:hypothetical protein